MADMCKNSAGFLNLYEIIPIDPQFKARHRTCCKLSMNMEEPAQDYASSTPPTKTTIIDLFAGAGGNSIAFALSNRWAHGDGDGDDGERGRVVFGYMKAAEISARANDIATRLREASIPAGPPVAVRQHTARLQRAEGSAEIGMPQKKSSVLSKLKPSSTKKSLGTHIRHTTFAALGSVRGDADRLEHSNLALFPSV
ncbi:putative diacylglycerol O-acyltransferase tgs1 [Ciborinia camelliae]|nr:putative diacylglycerol O-acyltransferase tgs1 [Ciborinia camelliae]